MNKTIITLLLALIAMAGYSQELKMNEPTTNDYIPLLNAKGYKAYSFDVSSIKGRNLTVNYREFVNGKEVEDYPQLLMPYTFESNGDKLIFGFLPSETSSLKLKQIYWESEDKYIYSYISKPFELTTPLEKETFIPLVCYCSFWYDAEDKLTRCCGEDIIKPDLSSDILKYVPHYYVLGITIH